MSKFLTGGFQVSKVNNPYLLGISKEAVVEEIIRPHEIGRIRYRGTTWNAKCLEEITINPGEVVYVVGNDNITLIVDTCPQSDDNSSDRGKKKSASTKSLFVFGNFLLFLLTLL